VRAEGGGGIGPSSLPSKEEMSGAAHQAVRGLIRRTWLKIGLSRMATSYRWCGGL
jgi:hypothetical protein